MVVSDGNNVGVFAGQIAVASCTTHISNSAAFNALPTALLTVWDTAPTAEVKTEYPGQIVGWDFNGAPYTWLPQNAGYIACHDFVPPKSASSQNNNNKLRRRQIPGGQAQSWSATTQCFTEIGNAAQYSALAYQPTVFWNDGGTLTTQQVAVGAHTSWDNNGFPVTVLPNGAGEVYCTTSVQFGLTAYTPTVASTWWTNAVPAQTAPAVVGGSGSGAAGSGLVGYSTVSAPAAASGQTGANGSSGFRSSATRFKFSDPMVVLTFGVSVLGMMGLIAVL